jgi:ribose 5-phosphate isomerase B
MAHSKLVLIASDHAGVALKAEIQRLLPKWEWQDLGPPNANRVDYPDFAERLAQKIAAGEAIQGVLVCGSGIGMSIAANKVDGVRAAMVENPVSARLSREHNDANVVCLGARFTAPEYAAEIVETFLTTQFAGERHAERVRKISEIEKRQRKG